MILAYFTLFAPTINLLKIQRINLYFKIYFFSAIHFKTLDTPELGYSFEASLTSKAPSATVLNKLSQSLTFGSEENKNFRLRILNI